MRLNIKLFIAILLIFLTGSVIHGAAQLIDSTAQKNKDYLFIAKQFYPKTYASECPKWTRIRDACKEGQGIKDEYFALPMNQPKLPSKSNGPMIVVTKSHKIDSVTDSYTKLNQLPKLQLEVHDQSFNKVLKPLVKREVKNNKLMASSIKKEWGEIAAQDKILKNALKTNDFATCLNELNFLPGSCEDFTAPTKVGAK